jgi:hypothetical protein
MKSLKIGVALAIAAATLPATSAQAAQTLTITGPSGNFGNDSVSGAFTNTFTFGAQSGFQLASISVESIATSIGAANDLTFNNVTFNGVQFNTQLTGIQELRNLFSQPLLANNVLIVSGNAGSNAAFSGTISFAQAAAVPEPGTWALMLLGFGAVGFSMRRRRQQGAHIFQAA